MISRNFPPPSIEHLQIFSSPDYAGIFFKIPQIRITGVVSADDFVQMHL